MPQAPRGYRRLIKRFQRGLRRHGPAAIFVVLMDRLTSVLSRLRPSVAAEMRRRRQEEAAFDAERGVDTGGWIHQTELNVASANHVHATSYAGSNPTLFRQAIDSLPIDLRRFVFVDFGSGKGRAVLLATEFAFRKIVGVEFSEELHTVARANLGACRSNNVQCDDVELVCMDVVDYVLPESPVVCYFCNPFDAVLMRQVLANIRQSFLRCPREIFIVYHNPYEARVIDGLTWFRPLASPGDVRIWQVAG